MCDMKYFMPAIDIIASKINDPHFFYFFLTTRNGASKTLS